MNRDKLPAHAKYSPSSINRLLACPMSINLCAKAPPQRESAYAAEGTEAHQHCEDALLDYGASIAAIGDPAMKAAAQIYLDYCDPILGRANEYGIEAKAVYSEELFGTVDCYALEERTLHIIDFKYGMGVAVSPDRNTQLMTYAGLIIEDQAIKIGWGDVDTVRLTVIQPRTPGEPVESWDCYPDVIVDHMVEVLESIRESQGEDPAGEIGDHCRWCTAKIICPAVKAAEVGVMKWDSRAIPPEELGEMLVQAHVVEMKIKELFSYAHSRLEDGVFVKGWKLVPKRASKYWTDPEKLEAWAKRNGHLNKLYQKKLITPAQAAKLFDDDSVNRFIESRSSGTNLKPSSDKAPEVQSLGGALSAIGSLS